MVCVPHLGQVIDFGVIRLSETASGDIGQQTSADLEQTNYAGIINRRSPTDSFVSEFRS